ncbi:MAG: hypothetical protein IT370_30220 [Deltaproteobacteria bacterium]|nr:hypothetical protein [Deltaproteobacteria bacterium]
MRLAVAVVIGLALHGCARKARRPVPPPGNLAGADGGPRASDAATPADAARPPAPLVDAAAPPPLDAARPDAADANDPSVSPALRGLREGLEDSLNLRRGFDLSGTSATPDRTLAHRAFDQAIRVDLAAHIADLPMPGSQKRLASMKPIDDPKARLSQALAHMEAIAAAATTLRENQPQCMSEGCPEWDHCLISMDGYTSALLDALQELVEADDGTGSYADAMRELGAMYDEGCSPDTGVDMLEALTAFARNPQL